MFVQLVEGEAPTSCCFPLTRQDGTTVLLFTCMVNQMDPSTGRSNRTHRDADTIHSKGEISGGSPCEVWKGVIKNRTTGGSDRARRPRRQAGQKWPILAFLCLFWTTLSAAPPPPPRSQPRPRPSTSTSTTTWDSVIFPSPRTSPYGLGECQCKYCGRRRTKACQSRCPQPTNHAWLSPLTVPSF